jgi:hypothetical protein
LVTVSVVDPVEADSPIPPEYVAKTVSVPMGAADELQEPLPLDSVAVHSDVEPVENVTDPVGVIMPPVAATVAE